MTTSNKPLRTLAQIKRLQAELLKRPYGQAFEVPFKPRSVIFKGSNLDFDPSTGLGHSYVWYEITKRIDGKLVLNTYAYSSSTVRHYSRLRSLFRQLGLRYVELQAPRGLQNLDAAASEACRQWCKLVVANEHARKPDRRGERALRATFDRTLALGGKLDQPIQAHMDYERVQRAGRLERARAKRALKRASALPLTNDDMRDNPANTAHAARRS